MSRFMWLTTIHKILILAKFISSITVSKSRGQLFKKEEVAPVSHRWIV